MTNAAPSEPTPIPKAIDAQGEPIAETVLGDDPNPRDSRTAVAPQTSHDLVPEAKSILLAIKSTYEGLPLDDDLATDREVAANAAQRNTLNHFLGRLPIDLQRVQALESKLPAIERWIPIATECLQDFGRELTAAETASDGRRTDMLRKSISDIANGPEVVYGVGEFMSDHLAKWFEDHDVHPLPGERGIFGGRGGLHAAVSRLAAIQRDVAAARGELEHTLRAAKASLALYTPTSPTTGGVATPTSPTTGGVATPTPTKVGAA